MLLEAPTSVMALMHRRRQVKSICSASVPEIFDHSQRAHRWSVNDLHAALKSSCLRRSKESLKKLQ